MNSVDVKIVVRSVPCRKPLRRRQCNEQNRFRVIRRDIVSIQGEAPLAFLPVNQMPRKTLVLFPGDCETRAPRTERNDIPVPVFRGTYSADGIDRPRSQKGQENDRYG